MHSLWGVSLHQLLLIRIDNLGGFSVLGNDFARLGERHLGKQRAILPTKGNPSCARAPNASVASTAIQNPGRAGKTRDNTLENKRDRSDR